VQSGEDLGRRMSRAFDHAFAAGRQLIVVGSDCPALTPAHLRAAARALAFDDAVFTPAEDGGYVLVGLARRMAAVFQRIEWSTDRVMADTRDRLREAGARWRELPVLWDVDRPADYARLRREGLLQEVSS
jgi:rSAM/selenodomain-associated transferase 1